MRRTTFAALLAVLLLAACGGTTDEPGQSELPTRVTIADATPETTPPPPAPAALNPTAPMQLPTGMPIPSDASTAEVTPPDFFGSGPSGLPGGMIVPNAEATEGVIVPSPGAIADFSTLEVSEDEVLLIGVLEINESTQQLLLTDENGLPVAVDMPVNLVANLVGQTVEIYGRIIDVADMGGVPVAVAEATGEAVPPEPVEATAEATGEAGVPLLAIRSSSLRPAQMSGGLAGVPGGFPGGLPMPEGFPTPDGTAEAIMPSFNGTMMPPPMFGPEGTAPVVPPGSFGGMGMLQGEALDFTLEENLTALAAYDALIEEISGEVEGRVLTIIRGSQATGWTFDFYSEEEDNNVSYMVSPDGTALRGPVSPALPLPGVGNIPLDREQIVVDSDDVVAFAQSAGGPPTPDVQMVLNATAEGVRWSTISPTPVFVDATVPIEQQPTPTPIQ
ncbi:MAG: hypothetical protein SF029_24765 [bacterium]|nr:hypothetical protein [bacterium]